MTLMERLRGTPVSDGTVPDYGERTPWRRKGDTLSIAPDQEAEAAAEPIIGNTSTFLVKLEKELARDRLNEIATLVRALTYGEMMELAKAFADIVAAQPVEIASLTDGVMAAVIHRWSGSR